MADVENPTNSDKCGRPRRQGNHSPCNRPAGWGTPHPGWGPCKLHGGNLPPTVRAAQKAAAQRVATIYGIPRTIDPVDGLMEEYWRTAGIITQLERILRSIPEAELVFGVSEIRGALPAAPAETGGSDSDQPTEGPPPPPEVVRKAAPNVWVKLFQEERAFYAKLGRDIAGLGLEARRDEYVRAQVEVFAGVLQAPELALSPEQLGVAARLLRALGAQPAEPLMIEASVEEAIDEYESR